MRILVVCQYYYPENFQITPICEQLVENGHRITVLTGLPNYPTGVIPPEYRKGHRDEIINGVHVLRVKEIARKKGPVRLFLNYLSFWINATRAVRKLKSEYDKVFVYQLSPVFMGLPAVSFAKKNHIPLITYVCDLWPESIKMYIKSEKNPMFKWVKRLSHKLYASSDKLLCQSPSFLDYLRDVHGIDDNRMEYLPAFADEDYLSHDFTNDNGIVDFVFLGNLGIAQNLLSVLRAVNIISDTPGFKVHFVGDGTSLPEMKQYVKENNLESIVAFYGRRPVEEMPKFYELADACLVSLKADSAVGLTFPAKVQGYMAAGKVILGMIEGSTKNVVEEAQCGVCVPADDIDGFANVLKDFVVNTYRYKDYGNNGRLYFSTHFRKSIFIDRLTTILK